ncbi:MAG: gamma carbonic anhydrase family protein [Rickettsiales bacterium]|nr:gamma carbonic anhydrase family protein [Rickettsiales bacterium]
MNKSCVFPYKGILPKIDEGAFIAPNSSIIGDVTIGKGSGVWFNCVIRGDVEPITIGENTNIQDGTVIHCTRGGGKTVIGDDVTIGHKALLHACILQDGCFVGMGAILMDGVVVETGGMVAAGSLVTPNKRIKKGEIWAGNPAKFFRNMTQEEVDYIMISANNYLKHVDEYKA